MAVKVGKLSVKLVTQTAEFNKGMKKAKKDVIDLNKVMMRASTVAKNLAKALAAAGAVAAAAMAAGVKSTLEWGDSLAKTASKLGTTTEALAGMQLAAERSGLSAETLNMALQRMTRRIADASRGMGPAAKTFEEMGLSAEMLNKMDPAQQLELVLTELQKIGVQGDKVAKGFSIFDSEGVAMINMTAQGLAQAVEDTKRFGTALNSVDAKKMEIINDTFNDVKQVMRGVLIDITADLLPTMKVLADWIIRVTFSIKNLINAIELHHVKLLAMTSAIIAVIAIAPRIVKVLTTLIALFKNLAKAESIALSLGGPAGWAQLAVGLTLAGTAVATINYAFNEMEQTLSQTNDEFDNLLANMEEMRKMQDPEPIFKVNGKEMNPDNPLAKYQPGYSDWLFDWLEWFERNNPEYVQGKGFSPMKLDFTERDKLLNDLKEQARNAGKTQDEIILEQIRSLSGGKDAKQYQQALNAIDMRKRRENMAALADEMERLNKEVEDFGKSDIELQLDKFKELGATALQLQELREQLELLQKKKEEARKAEVETGEFREVTLSMIRNDRRVNRKPEEQLAKRSTEALEKYLPDIAENTRKTGVSVAA